MNFEFDFMTRGCYLTLSGRWTLRSEDEAMASSLLRVLFVLTDHHQWKVSSPSVTSGLPCTCLTYAAS